MPVTYEKADHEVHSLIRRVMKQYHPDLATLEVKLCVLMANAPKDEHGQPLAPAIKLHGVPCAATIQILPYKQRAAGREDAELLIDADQWKMSTDPQREALIDHELMHLDPQRDEEGAWKSDDCGRPKLKTRHHDFDFGWFRAVAERHADASGEVQQAKAFADENGQTFFGWAAPPAGAGIEQGPTPTVAMDKLNEIVTPEMQQAREEAERAQEYADMMDAVEAADRAEDDATGACPHLSDGEPAAKADRVMLGETAWIDITHRDGKYELAYAANIGRQSLKSAETPRTFNTRADAMGAGIEDIDVWLGVLTQKGFRGGQQAQADAIKAALDDLLSPAH